LDKGSHVVSISNQGNGLCDIDVIAIIEPSVLESKVKEVVDTIQQSPGRLVYYLQAEDLFAAAVPKEWSSVSFPYNGTSLYTEGLGVNISPEGNASASSALGLDARYATDGDPATRWASEAGMPQWLEVEWSSPRELTEVKISFERALAEDYLVQSWNGTQWVVQADVKGNNELERYHTFDKTVKTDKLRIFVTKAPAFNLVSIWQLECFSTGPPPQLSTNLRLPVSGKYVMGLRLLSGTDQGNLNLSIDNFSTTVTCLSTQTGFDWYEVGPLGLVAGNNTLSLSASGKIALDSIILYSIRNNETALSLSQLFRQDTVTPSISYDILNPCQYILHIRCDRPFFLVFSETYNNLWKLHADDSEIPHVVAYSFLNGYLVNRTGQFDLVLAFEGQTYAEIGVMITVVSFIATSTYFIIQHTRLRSFLHKLRKHCPLKATNP
jgi:hypothetical protein